MPAGPARRAQTTKQAKAAFKARGSSFVSPTERKKLERGAELLKRAERAKAQEAKKKDWSKKRDGEATNYHTDHRLGSQRRLDKFGYASSQFHLGRFFKPPDQNQQAAGPDAQCHSTPSAIFEDGNDADVPSPGSPIDMSIFLDSYTQVARDLGSPQGGEAPKASEPPQPSDKAVRSSADQSTLPPQLAPAKKLQQSFPSFGSEDGLFDENTLEELDRVADDLEFRRSQSPLKTSQSQQTSSDPRIEGDRKMMPPPVLPLLKSGLATKTVNASSPSLMKAPPRPFKMLKPTRDVPIKSREPPRFAGQNSTTNLDGLGLSSADWDILADDIVLTQVPNQTMTKRYPYP